METLLNKKPGEAKADGLKDPSILDPKTSEEKAKDKDIKKKVSGVAKKPQPSNTNIQTAMLLEPEKLLKKYEKPMMLNEGAMPVTEEEFTPSDYFKTEMMKQWLFAEGRTGDKDGQETNQAFKGIHIDSYPELAEEIRQGTLTDEKVAEIMYRQYTGQNVSDDKPSKFRDLSQLENVNPEAAKLLFMDAGYTGQNAGAIKDLQRYLVSKNKKIEVDGLLGEKTLEVMNDFDAEEYRKYLGTLDRYSGEKGSKVYNRFFTEEERQQLGLYEKELNAMAKGGSIDIQKFMEGGLADNADDTPGATESEVADDIPAMISEGELVVPANVVRYHGLSKYENMRKTALKALDELEDNGQIRPVDEDGTPIVKDVKEQTDEVMASKGATVARYNEGGSPAVVSDDDEKVIGKPVDPNDPRFKDLKPVGPRITPREGQTITPDDSGNKATLTTPEGRNYRVTDPDTKITATGPRTTGIVGGNYTGVDLENMPGFGVDRSGSTPPKPSTTEQLLSGVATVAALDKLFLDGAITESVFNWARNNIFDPVGKFLGFDKAAAANAGILTSGATAAMTGTSITVGNTIVPIGSKVALTTGAPEAGLFSGSQYTTMVDGKIVRLTPGEAYIVSGGETGVYDGNLTNVNTSGSASTKTGADLTGEAPMSSNGVWNWKTGLAAVGAGLSLYDIIENGPSVGNVAGLGYSTGVLAQGGLLGAGAKAATTGTALGSAVSVLGYVALAAGVISLFKGPPSTYVGEAAIDFDKDVYSPDDIIVGGFTGSKFSQENRDGAEALINTAGGYVAALEESLEINIGGELFIDVGNEFGLRYGYVDGYDELGMYKYHEKDLDYKLLYGQGQVGKGLRGDDAAEKMMNKINDDINVVTMFALADKAAGGEGYATFDKMGEYRKKISVLSTYRPGMAGAGSQAVLTDYERNLLDGFQKKEFAEVTGNELAALMPIYDKIAPVQQQNSFNFNSLAM